jgi:hypothetical protein
MIELPLSPAAPSHEPALAQSPVPDLCHDSSLPAGRRARLGAHVRRGRLAGPAGAATHQSGGLLVWGGLLAAGCLEGLE